MVPAVMGATAGVGGRAQAVFRSQEYLEILLIRAGGGKVNGHLNTSSRLRKTKTYVFMKVMTETVRESIEPHKVVS